ncbi:MAG: hypothetical protein JW812_00310, partial [Alphaproteobacteria bacterium]|nr:hypothetical protein [Alphaproteobacteria bacterium]
DRSKFYHTERRPKVKSVTKEDCRYQTKICLDEFCLDEYDGYKKCKDNSITDFYGLVETCMDALPTGNERASYRRSCQPYMDSVINDYLKQMKSFMRYQTDMNKCDLSRDRLEAAQACYGIAISRGGAKSKTLKSLLTKACGDDVTGGSELMVEEFWGAGYMGADGAGWLANFAMLNFGSKQHGWQKVVDATLARYIDRKRVDCGEGEYTVGEVGKYSAKLVNAGDALRLGAASAILKKNMQTQEAANSVGNVIFLDTQTKTGSYNTPINPAASESDAQMHLAKATKALALGKSFPVSIEDLNEIYYTAPVAGDVLIWYQHNQSTKCYTFVVKDPSEGDLEPVSRRQFESLKMLNKELTSYYDKCFKKEAE